MAQQHLRDAVTSRHEISSTRIMGAHQFAGTPPPPRTGGPTTLVNEPASSNLASSSASLRSVVTRSDSPLGALPGAMTSTLPPGRARGKIEPRPVGSAA